MDIKEKIKKFPSTPGVYIMRDADQEVLYVGKARNLRKRVSSYFCPGKHHTARIGLMVRKVTDVSCLPTSTEAEALIYENGLIKKLKPKYNVALRDDKSYPMLKLTVGEKFPRLFLTRQKISDGSLYYGPYADAGLLKQSLEILREFFPLRNCSKMGKRPCLNFHINRCLAPCAGMINSENYGELIEEIKLFLAGRKKELLQMVADKMNKASRAERFEEAAFLRTRLEALSHLKDERVKYSPGGEVEELKTVTGLTDRPDTIEAFDISNIAGEFAVGSMVCFYKGKPRKNQYRKFRVTTPGIDDYAMIREIVRRRYKRLIDENGKLPDLIVIDGGKGHLAAASDELERLGLSRIPVISIAKEFEKIFIRGRVEPLLLPKESKALHLVQRIRDEAHRFAVLYHKGLRSKNMAVSFLDEIPGIGPKRKMALVGYFGTFERLKSAGKDEILKVKGIDEKTARSIIDYFKG